jgi:DNA-binding MarR family transcriptional regulator
MDKNTDKSKALAASCLNINAASVLLGLSLVNKAKLHLKTPLKEAKLTMNQWLILKIIYLRRADNPSTVAKTIDADPERKHGEDDRRKIELNITPKGTAVAKNIYKSYSGILQNF